MQLNEYTAEFMAISMVLSYIVAKLSFKYNWKLKDWF